MVCHGCRCFGVGCGWKELRVLSMGVVCLFVLFCVIVMNVVCVFDFVQRSNGFVLHCNDYNVC